MTTDTLLRPESPHRVLVVDDQPDIVYFLRLFLEEAGFEVEQATSGAKAIELLTGDCRHEFEVVVLDVRMPDVDGIEVAGEARACEECQRTRIVFIRRCQKKRCARASLLMTTTRESRRTSIYWLRGYADWPRRRSAQSPP